MGVHIPLSINFITHLLATKRGHTAIMVIDRLAKSPPPAHTRDSGRPA